MDLTAIIPMLRPTNNTNQKTVSPAPFDPQLTTTTSYDPKHKKIVQLATGKTALAFFGAVLVFLSVYSQLREANGITNCRSVSGDEQSLYNSNFVRGAGGDHALNKRRRTLLNLVTSQILESDQQAEQDETSIQRQVVSVLFAQVEKLIEATSQTEQELGGSRSCQAKQSSLEKEIQEMKQKVVTVLEQTQPQSGSHCPKCPSPKSCPKCPAPAASQSSCPTCPTCPSPSTSLATIDKSGKASSTTTTIASLEAAWQEMTERFTDPKEKQKFRVMSNVIVRTQPAKVDQITLLTHISANQLERLVLVEHFWGGPMSIAVWIKSWDDIGVFFQFLQEQAATNPNGMPAHASYHVLMEYRPNAKKYPHNRLRNIAAKYSDTDYFVSNDADIVTNPGAHDQLMALIHTPPTGGSTQLNLKAQLEQRSIFILPVFERFLPDDFKGVIVTEDYLPRTKQDVLNEVKAGNVAPFYATRGPRLAKIQGPTDFDKWYQNETDIYYPIHYADDFEPYVLGHRYGAPQYWEGFRGYGYNKQSWFYEAGGKMKYKFFTLRDFFMVHRNHISKRSQSIGKDITANANSWSRFQQYLQNHYSTTCL